MAEPPTPSDDSVLPGPAGTTFRPPPRPRRRWPWIVVVVALLAAVGASTVVALDQRETAARWRERTVAVEHERDEALLRGEQLEEQRNELAASLSASEADVAELEERVRELADEKAQAEDAATTTQVERDVVVEVANDVTAASEALDACVDRLFELQGASVEAFNRTLAGDQVDVEPLNEQARETTAFCDDARRAAAAASAAAQSLDAP